MSEAQALYRIIKGYNGSLVEYDVQRYAAPLNIWFLMAVGFKAEQEAEDYIKSDKSIRRKTPRGMMNNFQVISNYDELGNKI